MADLKKKQIPLRLSSKLYAAIASWAEDDFRSVNGQIEYLLTECVKQRKKDGKYVSETIDEPYNKKKKKKKKESTPPPPSSLFLFIQIVSRSLIAPAKRKLSTMITKNRADFIIAVMGNSIKCEKAGVRNLFLTPALRL